jgi:uncharacterized damage-inducible protein DinB
MFTKITDFLKIWESESASTLKAFQQLTDKSLTQEVYPGGRTLGRLANHIIETLSEMPHKLGLGIDEEKVDFHSAKEMADAYQKAAERLAFKINEQWTDANLDATTNMYGEEWKNGFSLWVLITHQIHHRAQMTVLMRQAGLNVPGIYGPSKEEWLSMGMKPLD